MHAVIASPLTCGGCHAGFEVVHTSHRLMDEKHLRAHAHASVFCLAPTGSGFGARLKLVTMSGCIPVVIDDLVRVSAPLASCILRVWRRGHCPRLSACVRSNQAGQITVV